jgi:hypothetical protein
MRTETEWKQIATVFQSSRRSTRDIAREFGISEKAIRKKAKERNWVRPEPEPDWDECPITVKADIDPSSTAVEPPAFEDVAGSEPGELVKRGRGIILALMAELEVETANVHLLAELVEIETAEDKTPHRRRALQKALSLPVRTQAAKNLSTALATLRDADDGKKAQRQATAEAASNDGPFALPEPPRALKH